MTRRNFLLGTAAGVAAAALGDAAAVDANLSVFLSDIHVSGDVPGQPTYQNPLFEKVVDQVLAMRPRPKQVVIFGDVALWTGRSEDYAASQPGIRRLEEAGIPVFLTTGNHDHRDVLFRFHPKQAALTPVPGRVTSVVDLGTADLLLLDSLDENPAGEGKGNPVAGTLDAAQADWMLAFAASARRPFFVGCHHPPEELSVTVAGQQKNILAALHRNDRFAGFIHGHNHRWVRSWAHVGYAPQRVVRVACLPSTGWWGNIGFATMRTGADQAELAFVQNDFFFPAPLKPGEKRPAEWDELMRENRDSSVVFRYGR